MTFLKSKKMATAISLFLMLTMTATLVVLPLVGAQTGTSTSVVTYAYVTVSPSPIGVGQTAYILAWINWLVPTAGAFGGDRWYPYTITVTKPDGSITTIGPLSSDGLGSTYQAFVPDQTGTYTVKFEFGGHTLVNGTNPNAIGAPYVGLFFQPSSATTTFVAQQEPISSAPTDTPLPDRYTYWERPIAGDNSLWTSIAGNWYGGPSIVNSFQPFSRAPDSAHIVWTKPITAGGLVGSTGYEYKDNPSVDYYSGLSYELKYAPVIMNGILYYSDFPTNTGIPEFRAVDLRTGKEIYFKSGMEDPTLMPVLQTGGGGHWGFKQGGPTVIKFGMMADIETPNQHGVVGPYLFLGGNDRWLQTTQPNDPNALIPIAVGLRWEVYDAFTGKWLMSMTNVPSGGGPFVIDHQGDIVQYFLNTGKRWLALWNLTNAMPWPGSIETDSWQFRPYWEQTFDAQKNWNNGTVNNPIVWNITLPANVPTPGYIGGGIAKVVPDDMIIGANGLVGTGTATSVGSPVFYGTLNPWGLWAINLKSGHIGELLYAVNYTAPAGNITTVFGPVDPVNRVITINQKETRQWYGYSMDTGQLLWGPTAPQTTWDYYGVGGAIAYGTLYSSLYGGILNAYNITTGKLIFTYGNGGAGNSTAVPYTNPLYPKYPLTVGAIADDKVFLYTTEHSPNSPPWVGAQVRAVDAHTGKELWTLPFWASGFSIADGYLTTMNIYDNRIYVFGKGKTETTVNASPDITSSGNKILITGSVTDQSPGALLAGSVNAQSSSAKGTPAISDDSMSAWMAYMYMQKPMPADATGVEVSLDSIDPNGNFVPIGTTTSDASGQFSFVWQPPLQGSYKILATFAGTKSYFKSNAETQVAVTAAAAPAPTPAQPAAAADNTGVIVGTGIAVIAAVAIAAGLILRKRP